MKKIITALLSLCAFITQAQTLLPDSILSRSITQNLLLPQEKLYIHTDKPTYIAGEEVWLRAHIVDGSTHVPAIASRYAYVELQNPFQETITRIRLRADNKGHIYGYLPLSKELPTGEYTLTAYTRFMENQGEECFFRKRLYIANAMNKSIRMETRMDDTFLYIKYSNPVTGELLKFHSCVAKLPSGEIEVQRSDTDFRIQLPHTKEHTLLVQTDYYKEFISIASRHPDYDVTFHPEGGNLPTGTLCRIAFKALNNQGQGENVQGTLRDSRNQIITRFQSTHLGMGILTFIPKSGEKYRAVCQNAEGKTKTFDLPLPEDQAFSLQVTPVKNYIYAKVQHNPNITFTDSLFIFTHQRGTPKHIGVWKQGIPYIPFDMEDFTSGSASFLLVDRLGKIISERMMFIHRDDLARGNATSDKPQYGKKEKMLLNLQITDAQGEPWNGNCSVAITDNADVQPDSSVNILSTLLLTSDLKGYIEEPAWYFAKGNTAKRQQALDILMMTQGWKRYDWQRAWQADYDTLKTQPEQSQVFIGKVTKQGTELPIEGAEVQMIGLSANISEKTQTDADGRFHFTMFEAPASTSYWLSAHPSSDKANITIQVNEETFPTLKKRVPPLRLHHSIKLQKSISVAYIDKADRRATIENTFRHIPMNEVLVIAPREFSQNEYKITMGAQSVKEYEIRQSGVPDMQTLLREKFACKAEGTFILDGIIIGGEGKILEGYPLTDIKQVDVIQGPQVVMFHNKTPRIISITTKQGEKRHKNNLRTIIPLGYQEPIAFYSPKYDTALNKESKNRDLRTTIHWQPSVIVKDGKTLIECYTSDSPVNYTLVMEGVGNDGSLLHVEEQMGGI